MALFCQRRRVVTRCAAGKRHCLPGCGSVHQNGAGYHFQRGRLATTGCGSRMSTESGFATTAQGNSKCNVPSMQHSPTSPTHGCPTWAPCATATWRHVHLSGDSTENAWQDRSLVNHCNAARAKGQHEEQTPVALADIFVSRSPQVWEVLGAQHQARHTVPSASQGTHSFVQESYHRGRSAQATSMGPQGTGQWESAAELLPLATHMDKHDQEACSSPAGDHSESKSTTSSTRSKLRPHSRCEPMARHSRCQKKSCLPSWHGCLGKLKHRQSNVNTLTHRGHLVRRERGVLGVFSMDRQTEWTIILSASRGSRAVAFLRDSNSELPRDCKP